MFIVRSRSFGFTGAACGTLRQLRAAEACWGPSEYDVRGGGSQIEDSSTERLRECHIDRIRDTRIRQLFGLINMKVTHQRWWNIYCLCTNVFDQWVLLLLDVT